MGFATRLGPWLLGTVKTTTGATAGLIANTGTANASQTFKIDYTGTTTGGRTDNLFVIPAGAQIIQLNVDTLTAFTGSTAANAVIGTAASTALFMASTDLTAAGRVANAAFAAKLAAFAGVASTAAPYGIGVGPTDVIIQAVMSPTVGTVTLGLVQYTVLYTVRNPDGTFRPTYVTT